MTGKSALAVLLAIVTLGAVACGGAEPTAASPKSPSKEAPGEEPRTAEEAQDQIDAARAIIDQSVRTEGPVSADAAKSDQPTVKAEQVEAVCAGRCKALASMKRAVDALCRMTGESEARCVSAKRTYDASSTRIADCSCH